MFLFLHIGFIAFIIGSISPLNSIMTIYWYSVPNILPALFSHWIVYLLIIATTAIERATKGKFYFYLYFYGCLFDVSFTANIQE